MTNIVPLENTMINQLNTVRIKAIPSALKFLENVHHLQLATYNVVHSYIRSYIMHESK